MQLKAWSTWCLGIKPFKWLSIRQLQTADASITRMARELSGRWPCLFLNGFRAQGRSCIDSGGNKTLTAGAGATPWGQWHSPTLSYPPASLPTWGEPLRSFSLSDKPAFDLCTEPARYCQMRTVTCPPDCICVGYQEPSHDRCRHWLHWVRPSSEESFPKHCQRLETFNLPSKVFNERTFDKKLCNTGVW